MSPPRPWVSVVGTIHDQNTSGWHLVTGVVERVIRQLIIRISRRIGASCPPRSRRGVLSTSNPNPKVRKSGAGLKPVRGARKEPEVLTYLKVNKKQNKPQPGISCSPPFHWHLFLHTRPRDRKAGRKPREPRHHWMGVSQGDLNGLSSHVDVLRGLSGGGWALIMAQKIK